MWKLLVSRGRGVGQILYTHGFFLSVNRARWVWTQPVNKSSSRTSRAGERGNTSLLSIDYFPLTSAAKQRTSSRLPAVWQRYQPGSSTNLLNPGRATLHQRRHGHPYLNLTPKGVRCRLRMRAGGDLLHFSSPAIILQLERCSGAHFLTNNSTDSIHPWRSVPEPGKGTSEGHRELQSARSWLSFNHSPSVLFTSS